MKKLLISLLLLSLIPIIYVFFFSPPSPSPSSATPQHPLSATSLSSHINPNTTLKVEKEISSRSAYKTYLVSYLSENLTQYALMSLPTAPPPPNGWPVIIINHGYIPPNQYSTLLSYINTFNYYSSSGFLVLKPDFRGHNNSQGQGDQLLSRSSYAIDVLHLLSGLGSVSQADTNNVFMYGHSMGAEVSLLVAQNSPQVKALSLWAPAVTDFPQNITYFRNRHLPVSTDQPSFQSALDQLLTRYPASDFTSLAHLDKINIPIIIHHSPTDESVPYSWSQTLNKQLQQQNKTVTFYTYQNDDHNLSRHWSQALNRDLEFFRSNYF